MANLKRNDKVRLFNIGGNAYEVRSMQDDVVLNSNDNYFIYMQNVNFRSGNIIEGRYLGTLEENSPLIDKYCKTVISDGGKFTIDGEKIGSAKMVAVNNKTKVIMIIQSR